LSASCAEDRQAGFQLGGRGEGSGRRHLRVEYRREMARAPTRGPSNWGRFVLQVLSKQKTTCNVTMHYSTLYHIPGDLVKYPDSHRFSKPGATHLSFILYFLLVPMNA
jgi:hypothetical protein